MKNNYSILIVEDEVMASTYLSELLNSLGHTNLHIFKNAEDAFKILDTIHIDFAFLDINIQGSVDGIQLAHLINEEYFIPVIFTTGYNHSSTMKEASQTNMFGYLMKPFVASDIEASIYTYKSRTREKTIKKVQKSYIELCKKCRYHIKSETLYINSISINLTKKEREILSLLVSNINNNISYDTIKEEVWQDTKISTATIRDIIRRLRAKAPTLNIQSISGFGYTLYKS